MIQTFLPGINLDEFVMQKVRNQMKKRRAVELKRDWAELIFSTEETAFRLNRPDFCVRL